ncbi:MAG: hypothetical protein Q7O66_06840 [Dehalococcoidia bacterium]|nr:hypothetical protein [Dehalococcoidia bacterium]
MGYAVEEWGHQIVCPGQIVPAGRYMRVDADTARLVTLAQEGMLPASFDGHVATYVRLEDLDCLSQQLTLSGYAESTL